MVIDMVEVDMDAIAQWVLALTPKFDVWMSGVDSVVISKWITIVSPEIDCLVFVGLVDEALRAFETDPEYATKMARRASTIQGKRKVWSIRTELRQVERVARVKCIDAHVFYCTVQGPCGTGQCPFAEGDFADVHIPAVDNGKVKRPVLGDFPTYDIESAVGPLQQLRAS